MKHLGDISRIRGGEIPVVDVIIGGSPCQDLSVAGKRAGLEGERSGLFLEQIRVIKEMREHDRSNGRTGQFVRPRYAVWENVAGAFSGPGKGHAGEDFAAVLTEFVRIAEPEAPAVAVPDKGWPMAGCLYGEDGSWSVAWRLFDAQFWGPTLTADGRVLAAGTPQRRQRVALVADLGGLTASEVLFEREGLSGDPEPGGAQGQGAAGEAADRAGGADQPGEAYRIGAYYSAGMMSDNPKAGIVPVEISNTIDCNGGAPNSQQGGVCIVDMNILDDQGGQQVGARTDGVCPTLRAETHGNIPAVPEAKCLNPWDSQGNAVHDGTGDTIYPCLRGCGGAGYQAGYVMAAEGLSYFREDSESYVVEAATYDARGNGNGSVCCTMTGDHQDRVTDYTSLVVEPKIDYIVRRLTPMECERLQGFPDGWTLLPVIEEVSEEDFRFYDAVRREAARIHRKSYKTPSREGMVKWWNKMAEADSPRYRSLGNSICLPGWKWICKRICAQYERDATMGSLFDGIGGFPLIWERLNGRGMCLWASEVEPFQIAVTRMRFRAEEIGKWL